MAGAAGGGDPNGKFPPVEGAAPKGLLVAPAAFAGGTDPKGAAGGAVGAPKGPVDGAAPKGLLVLAEPPKPPKPAIAENTLSD